MRPAHRLKGNRRTGYPRHAVWFDTETREVARGPDSVEHHLLFGWALHRRRETGHRWSAEEWFRFETPEEFWTWLYTRLRPGVRLDLYAHNAGFDLTVVDAWRRLKLDGWDVTHSIIDAPPLCVSWRRGKTTIRALDTLNWWREKLEKVGEYVGTEKLPMPETWGDRERDDEYCRGDVRIIHDACMKWWGLLNDNDLGNAAVTIAAQAMNTYRHRFMHHDILIDDNERALKVARNSYRGGRTECFHIGRVEGPIYHLDVNSMYPAVMRNGVFPCKLVSVYRRPSLDELIRWTAKYRVCGDCLIETDEPAYLVRIAGKSLFPVGRLHVSLTTPEMVYAIEHEHLRACMTVAVYTGHEIFTDFVETLYGLRMMYRGQGNDAGDKMMKKLLNSLYGKWGQNGRKFTKVGETDDLEVKVWTDIDAQTGEVTRMRQYAGIIESMQHEGESYHSHPAIAAHVTAEARMMLWRYILKAGRENVLYTDTDSLFVTPAGKARLGDDIDPDRLGALKEERVYPWVHFHTLKDYETPEYRKLKGIRDKAVEIQPNVWRQEKWIGLRGLIAAGDISHPVVEQVVKHLSRIYNKGTVSPSGRVDPLRLESWGGVQ